MNTATANQWFSAVKAQLENNPLASNIGFALILFCFEKIVELEFVCPCQSKLNALSALSFFLAPAVIVFLLTLSTESLCKPCMKNFLRGAVPAVTWIIILLMDGRYYACLLSNWSGNYEVDEAGFHLKWCKPANVSHEEKIQTLNWYTVSQVIGLWLAVGLTVVFKGYLLYCKLQERTDDVNATQDFALSTNDRTSNDRNSENISDNLNSQM